MTTPEGLHRHRLPQEHVERKPNRPPFCTVLLSVLAGFYLASLQSLVLQHNTNWHQKSIAGENERLDSAPGMSWESFTAPKAVDNRTSKRVTRQTSVIADMQTTHAVREERGDGLPVEPRQSKEGQPPSSLRRKSEVADADAVSEEADSSFRPPDYLESIFRLTQHHSVCDEIVSSTFPSLRQSSAQYIWMTQLRQVIEASQMHENDPRNKFQGFILQLLERVTPILSNSVGQSFLPTSKNMSEETMNKILSILKERAAYVRQQVLDFVQSPNASDPSDERRTRSPRPLRIAFFGGSVVLGTNCRALLGTLGFSLHLPKRHCNYAHRFQIFLNNLLMQYTIDSINEEHRHRVGTNGQLLINANMRKKLLLKHAHEKDEDRFRFQHIHLTKLTMGGTNTRAGTKIVEYNLGLEGENSQESEGLSFAQDIDVIVNGYSTNDMHVLSMQESQGQNLTHREYVLQIQQEFVRAIYNNYESQVTRFDTERQDCNGSNGDGDPTEKNRSESPTVPLLLFINDYVGNEQNEIINIMEMEQSLQSLSTYYGGIIPLATISFAKMIQSSILFQDVYETWFSPDWFEKMVNLASNEGDVVGELGEFSLVRQIHPGMGMHIAMPWVISYNLLHYLVSYCQTPLGTATTLSSRVLGDYTKSFMTEVAPLPQSWTQEVPGKPRTAEGLLPPQLTRNTSIESLGKHFWYGDGDRRKQKHDHEEFGIQGHDTTTSACTHQRPCLFAWIGGLSQQQNNMTWIEETFDWYTVSATDTSQSIGSVDSWKLVRDNGKIGWVPREGGVGDKTILRFPNVTQSLSKIEIFYMKSYGKRWEGSAARIEVSTLVTSKSDDADWKVLEGRSLLAYHAKNTSEMYTESIVLSPAIPTGASLQLTYTLASGQTFKLMGLAICT